MADLNTVALVGRLTRDPEGKTSTSGARILNFTLAQNQRQKQGDQYVDQAHFFDCTYIGRGAEAVERYLAKGKQLAITGQLQQDRWQDQNGNSRSKVKILVQSLQLLGGRSDGGGSDQSQPTGGHEPGSFDNSFNEDIPF